MNILRKTIVGLCAAFLGTTLLALAATNTSISTIHNHQVVKGWFEKSGFYTEVSNIAVTTIKNDAGSSAIPIDDPAVQKIIANTLNPDFVKTSLTNVLDSVYTWLGGTQDNLAFNLDLTSAKDQLTTGLTKYAKDRAVSLPTCGAIERNNPVEPFTATCLPLGVTADQVATKAREQFLAQDFLKNPVIKGGDFTIKDKAGNSIPVTSDERVQLTRRAYRLSGSMPLLLSVICLVLIAGVVFLSKTRLAGIRRVGIVFLTAGVGLLLLYFGIKFIYNWASSHVMTSSGGVVAQTKLGLDFFRVALIDIERILLTHAIAFCVLGLLAILIVTILLRRSKLHIKRHAEDIDNNIPEYVVPVIEAPASPLDPRPPVLGAPPRPKTPRKIQ